MEPEWITVLTTYDRTEAEIVADLLTSGGISTQVRSAKVTPYPVNIGKMGEVKVMVREEDRAAALEMIESFMQDKGND